MFVMWQLGIFEPFWFWTIEYARNYSVLIPLPAAAGLFQESAIPLFQQTALAWIVAACGLSSLVWDSYCRRRARFVIAWLAASMLSVVPGLRFTPHAYVFVLPVLSVLVALGCVSIGRWVERRSMSATGYTCVGLLVLAVVLSAGWTSREYLFWLSPTTIPRRLWKLNPFPEAIEVAREIRSRAHPGDTLYVSGSEPELHFYTGLRSATGHIYMYPLTDPHPYARELQRQLVDEVERSKPAFVVFVNHNGSWLVHPTTDRTIFDWQGPFLSASYRVVGVVDAISDDETRWIVGPEAANYQPRGILLVTLYERK
jgi:hypothetical protein